MHGYLLRTKYDEADVSCGPGDCLQSYPNKTREQVVGDGRATCHLYMALGVGLWSP